MTAESSELYPLSEPVRPATKNLWLEAFGRLIRNRAALAGGIIIILIFLTAIFADFVAPMPYDQQSLTEANSVPSWLTRIFPALTS